MTSSTPIRADVDITPHHRLRLDVGVGIITRLRRGGGDDPSKRGENEPPATEGTGAGGNNVT